MDQHQHLVTALSLTGNIAFEHFFSRAACYLNHHAVTKAPRETTAKPVQSTALAGQGRATAPGRTVADQARLADHAVAQERENHLDATPDVFSDERQLLESSASGRCILPHNISGFMRLAQTCPAYGGIVLAHQTGWTPSELIAALNRMLTETNASDWPGQVRWVNDWR